MGHTCIKETEIALLKNNVENMLKKIDKIDEKLVGLIELFNTFQGNYVKDKFHMEEKFDNKYSSKEELKLSNDRISNIESIISRLNWAIILFVISGILSLVAIGYKFILSQI